MSSHEDANNTETGHTPNDSLKSPVLIPAGHAAQGGAPISETPFIDIPRAGLFLGRRESSDGHPWLRLTHPRASGAHAAIERRGDDCWLRDLGSTNGTWVNARTISEPHALLEGDVVFVGGEAFVHRWLTQDDRAALLEEARAPFAPVPTRNAALARLLHRLRHLAQTKSELLLIGETGVGKEVYAQATHVHSQRKGKFVAINCAAVPADLVESELFGYVRGAHSQAAQAKMGVIEQAHEGTMFLDEIGDMPAAAQAKLLRFVQTKEVWPLGATQPRRIDVRIIAATSHLMAAIDAPGVRQDLMGRLGAWQPMLPPLRARREDIGQLIKHFATASGLTNATVDAHALHALLCHDWPRNVRELQSVIAEAVVFAQGKAVSLDHLPPSIARPTASGSGEPSSITEPHPTAEASAPPAARSPRPMPSKAQLEEMLAAHRGNVSHVARQLERHWKVVSRAISRYGIDLSRYRS